MLVSTWKIYWIAGSSSKSFGRLSYSSHETHNRGRNANHCHSHGNLVFTELKMFKNRERYIPDRFIDKGSFFDEDMLD